MFKKRNHRDWSRSPATAGGESCAEGFADGSAPDGLK